MKSARVCLQKVGEIPKQSTELATANIPNYPQVLNILRAKPHKNIRKSCLFTR